jgi:hypothetical protein
VPRHDPDIDRLFQVPPEEFTAARNALAKQAGSDGAAIKRLQKPPLAAWAVNQLFWKDRDLYDALVKSADALRRAHRGVITGHHADIRAAGKAHDQALDSALKRTLSLLAEAGHKSTDATRQAILNTLRALPSEDAPGRLTRVLQPGGFEMLSGIAPRAARPDASRSRHPSGEPREPAASGRGSGTRPGAPALGEPTPRHAATRQKPAKEKVTVDARALARAKEALARATREARTAEHAVRRDEFESARAAREAAKAASHLQAARDTLAAAQRDVDDAEREAAAAEKQRDAAERRAAERQSDLTAARERVEAAQAAIDAVRGSGSRGR